MSKPLVSIVMGSDSDLDIMREAAKALEEFGIGYEIDVTSAHRSPTAPPIRAQGCRPRDPRDHCRRRRRGASGRSHRRAYHAARNRRAHSFDFAEGMDSLLATVQMPAGIPVATVAIGKPGATNAGILAAQILGLASESLAKKLEAHKEKLANSVEEKSGS